MLLLSVLVVGWDVRRNLHPEKCRRARTCCSQLRSKVGINVLSRTQQVRARFVSKWASGFVPNVERILRSFNAIIVLLMMLEFPRLVKPVAEEPT